MKYILKIFLKHYLRFFAKLSIIIHNPYIIVVAGSTNKSFYKNEIIRILRSRGLSVRSNIKSFNTEFGLPLAIMSLPSGYGNYKAWLPAIINAPLSLFEKFPPYLVLELGTSKPKDMKFLLSIVNPDIAVITNITQRYLESFDDMNELSLEFEFLAQRSYKRGVVFMNIDNERLRRIAKKAGSNIRTFAVNEPADCMAENIMNEGACQSFSAIMDGESRVKKIDRSGRHHIYAALAGMLVADHLKLASK